MAGSQRKPLLSYQNRDESNNEVWNIKRELEGWREVLLPLASLFRWDEMYYPFIISGATSFLFFVAWYTGISTLTAFSLACMLVGIFDFIVPFVGPTITGTSIWTSEEESEFIYICELIASLHHEVIETWQGLKSLRHENAKIFFIVVVGVLTVTAWVGSVVSNFWLTYLVVTGVLLTPGLRHHGFAQKYTHLVMTTISALKIRLLDKPKLT